MTSLNLTAASFPCEYLEYLQIPSEVALSLLFFQLLPSNQKPSQPRILVQQHFAQIPEGHTRPLVPCFVPSKHKQWVSESRALLTCGNGLLHTVKPSPLNVCPDSRCVYSLSPRSGPLQPAGHIRHFCPLFFFEHLRCKRLPLAWGVLYPWVIERHSPISTGSLRRHLLP